MFDFQMNTPDSGFRVINFWALGSGSAMPVLDPGRWMLAFGRRSSGLWLSGVDIWRLRSGVEVPDYGLQSSDSRV